MLSVNTEVPTLAWVPDDLGPGFLAQKIDLGEDRDGPISMTLVRHDPSTDPHANWPDRLLPNNIVPGGALSDGSYVLLPEGASPQIEEELAHQASWSTTHPEAASSAFETTPGKESALGNDVENLATVLPEGAEIHLDLDRPARVQDAPAQPSSPSFAVLYVHGWNDYFYQTHLARVMSALGAAFYAVDLRRYGRSSRGANNEPYGFVRNLNDYGLEFSSALDIINAEHPGLPVIMMGHSTGGLSTALWAAKNPERLACLLLISPWLRSQPGHYFFKKPRFTRAVLRAGTRVAPTKSLPMASLNLYSRSISGWHEDADGPLPAYLRPFTGDPAVRGWWANPAWKILPTAPYRFGWLHAIVSGHLEIMDGLQAAVPTLVLSGALPSNSEGGPGEDCGATAKRLATWPHNVPKDPGIPLVWDPQMRHFDMVLATHYMHEAARDMGPLMETRCLSGVHDLTLSQPHERAELWRAISEWLHKTLPQS
ncbi:MAG: alpha/beta fold hydrolase [Actinomycetaceae bacterium]|nr:alpha/beta fold hydrolase [Actinomycetaceae bacterium]